MSQIISKTPVTRNVQTPLSYYETTNYYKRQLYISNWFLNHLEIYRQRLSQYRQRNPSIGNELWFRVILTMILLIQCKQYNAVDISIFQFNSK